MIRIEPRKRKTPEIGIAPLVDCVLLLLIFFLLTSSFSERRGIKITLPRSDTARATERDLVEITVAEAGDMTLAGRPVGMDELASVLKSEVEARGKLPVLMIADRRVVLEQLTEIMDSIRAAGLDSVAIAARAGEPADGEEGGR